MVARLHVGSLDLRLVLEVSYRQEHLVEDLHQFNLRPVLTVAVPPQKFSPIGLDLLDDLHGQFGPGTLGGEHRILVF